MLPGLAMFGLLVIIPVAAAIYFSFFQWNGLGGPPGVSQTSSWVGLGNFTRAFRDCVFRGDLWRGFVLIVLSLTIQLALSLGLELLLHEKVPGRTIFRLLFVAPSLLPQAST